MSRLDCGSAVAAIAENEKALRNSSGKNIRDRLWKKFGGGNRPEWRFQLFSRLERTVACQGESPYRMIVDAVGVSGSKDKPGNWFCKVIVARMIEHGIWNRNEVPDW